MRIFYITFGWIGLLLLTSCGQYKNIVYLQAPKPETDTLYSPAFVQYKLQPADILHIRVTSIDHNVSDLFNNDSPTASSSTALNGMAGGGMYLTGYSINEKGQIQLPVIGNVDVAGLTVEEATAKISQLTLVYIKDAHIEVKLVSFKIAVLGEVNHPGQITIFNNKATILEAIAQSGDLSYYGNRKDILIVRNVKNGLKTIHVDLTRRELLKSDEFYLQPNDVIYIEPLRSTVFRLKLSDYSVFLTLVTSTVTLVFLIMQASK